MSSSQRWSLDGGRPCGFVAWEDFFSPSPDFDRPRNAPGRNMLLLDGLSPFGMAARFPDTAGSLKNGLWRGLVSLFYGQLLLLLLLLGGFLFFSLSSSLAYNGLSLPWPDRILFMNWGGGSKLQRELHLAELSTAQCANLEVVKVEV